MPLFRRKQSNANAHTIRKSTKDRPIKAIEGKTRPQHHAHNNNKKGPATKKTRMRISWFMRGSSRNTTTPKTQDNASFFDDDDHSSLSSVDHADSDRDGSTSKSILKIVSHQASLDTVWQPRRPHSQHASLDVDESATQNITPKATARSSTVLVVSSALDKHVRFSEAIIHVHEIILGDCPTVSCGAPLALGKCLPGHEMILDISDDDEESVILEEYSFPETPNSRSLSTPYSHHSHTASMVPYLMSPPACTIHEHRSHKQLWIPEAERTERLMEWGYKEEDIQRAILFHTLTRLQEELVGRYKIQRTHH